MALIGSITSFELLPDAPTDPGASPALAKRQGTRWTAINKCPDQAQTPLVFATRAEFDERFFGGSRCNRGQDLRAWTISCSADNFIFIPYDGRCNDNEICIDGVQSAGHPDIAYCVQQEHYVNISNTLKAGQGAAQTKRVIANVPSRPGDNYIYEFAVGGKSGTDFAFKTNKVTIEAFDGNERLLDRNECSDCSSIGIQPWHKDVTHFISSVSLPNPGDEARVYGAALQRGLGF